MQRIPQAEVSTARTGGNPSIEVGLPPCGVIDAPGRPLMPADPT